MIDDLCEKGRASQTPVTRTFADCAMRSRLVYADLQRDAETARYIAQIEQLKQGTSTPAVAIPDECAGPAPDSAAQPTVQPSKTTTVTDLDGTWEVAFTEAELAATDGVDPSEIGPELVGTFVVTFDRGDITGPVKPGEPALTASPSSSKGTPSRSMRRTRPWGERFRPRARGSGSTDGAYSTTR